MVPHLISQLLQKKIYSHRKFILLYYPEPHTPHLGCTFKIKLEYKGLNKILVQSWFSFELLWYCCIGTLSIFLCSLPVSIEVVVISSPIFDTMDYFLILALTLRSKYCGNGFDLSRYRCSSLLLLAFPPFSNTTTGRFHFSWPLHPVTYSISDKKLLYVRSA